MKINYGVIVTLVVAGVLLLWVKRKYFARVRE